MKDKLINYFIENAKFDYCNKCTYFDGKQECCVKKKYGIKACRNGMLEFLEKQKAIDYEERIVNEFLDEIKKFGITRVARVSGVKRATIYAWITGKNSPSLASAEKVASAMGLELLLFEKE